MSTSLEQENSLPAASASDDSRIPGVSAADHASPPQTAIFPQGSDDQSADPSETQVDPPATIERPPFQPFFTLISDATTSTTYHPRQVHYIFSDDDNELLTAACLQAADSQGRHSPLESSDSQNVQRKTSSNESVNVHGDPQDPQSPARENRILLLDLDTSGTKVVKAHSLTPNWQILSTSLTPAPTWDAPAQDGASEDKNMMLRVEGTDGYEGTKTKLTGLGIKDGSVVGDEEFTVLMQDFDERMRMLRTIVATGEQGQQAEAAGAGAGTEHEDDGPSRVQESAGPQ